MNNFVVVLVLIAVIVVAASALGIAYNPGLDPVRQAEASAITARADMDANRQAFIYQQQTEITKAQAQAAIIDAQTWAQTAALWVAAWVVIALAIIGGVTLVLVARARAAREWEYEHPRMLYRKPYYIQGPGYRPTLENSETYPLMEVYDERQYRSAK